MTTTTTEKLFDRAGIERTPNATGDKGQLVYRTRRTCARCGGAGSAEKWRHTGLTCFDCGGSGLGGEEVHALYTTEKLATLNAALAKRHAKAQAVRDAAAAVKRAEYDAAWGAWYAVNGPACDAIVAFKHVHGIVSDVALYIGRRIPIIAQRLDMALSIVVCKLAEDDQRAASGHVGTVGERIELELVCEKALRFDFGSFPTITTYINLCRDRAGNRVVYKGSNRFDDDGEWFKVKATIKDHDSRDGELQTLIARPKFVA